MKADGLRVLYIDDESALLEVSKLFLERSGEFSVDIITSAPAALALLDSRTYDAVISDYQMPGMDGIEFLKRVRSSGNTIPFILFTGRGREEVVIQALNEGADFYLQKGSEPKSQFAELSHNIRQAVQRKRAENALRESEQKFSSVFFKSPAVSIISDLENGTFVEVNDAAVKVSGYSRDEIIGKTAKDLGTFVNYEDRDALVRTIRKGGRLRDREVRLRSRTGAIHTFLFSGEHIRTGDSDYMLLQGIDITERKEVERELNESEKRYRNVVEDQTEFISRFLPDGTHVFVNEAYCRYFGLKRDEILGHRFRPKILAEDQERVSRFFKSLTPDNPVDNIEQRIMMPDGSILWQRWSDRAIFDPSGTVIEYQSVGRDITEKKQTEEALRESNRKFQGIVSGSPIPQFVIGKDHRIISWNRALEEYSGVKADDVLGTTHAWKAFYDRERPVLADLLADNAIEKIPEWYAGKFKKSKFVDGAYEATDFFPRMGGGGTWLYFTAAALRDSEGTITGAVETLEDITERKKVENELRATNEQIYASEEVLKSQYDELAERGEKIRESEEFLRTVITGAKEGIIVYDRELRITFWNRFMEDLTGLAAADVQGKFALELFPFHKKIGNDLLMMQALEGRTGESPDFEFSIPSTGRKGWARSIFSPSHDVRGTITGVIGIVQDMTRRKQAEEALRESGEQYRSLVETTGTGYVILDTGGRVITANHEYLRLCGRSSPEDIRGRAVTDWTAPYDLERNAREVEQCFRTGQVRNLEIDYIQPDGSIIPVEINASVIRSGSGPIILTLCRDITQRRATEKSLKTEQEFTRLLLDTSPAFFVAIRADGRTITMNRALREVLEYTPEEIQGVDYVTTFVPEEDRELLAGVFRQIVDEGKATVNENRIISKSGKIHLVEWHGCPVTHEDKSLDFFVGVGIDITERKRAEELVRESEMKYRMLFESSRDALMTIEPPGFHFASCNAATLEMFGAKDEAEFVLLWPGDISPETQPDGRPSAETALAMIDIAIRTGSNSFEWTHRRRNGELFPCTVLISKMTLDGRTLLQATVRDITAIKQSENALREANRKLNLLSGITRHDIKNQLTIVQGFTKVAALREPDPVIADFLAKIASAADTIQHQIEFSRTYQDLGMQAPAWFRVCEVIRSVRPPEITLVCTCESCEIFADPMIGKVFFNLFDNAVKYGKRVTSVTAGCEQGGDGLVITFADNGIGIPPDEKQKIFDRGFGKNTGLGLFLVREILEITGITIRETGEPGKGARFELLVPGGGWRLVKAGRKR